MLTVDFDRLDVAAGALLLDLGCGSGRHAFEAARRGLHVVAVDRDGTILGETAGMLEAMKGENEIPRETLTSTVNADALTLPFPDGAFDAAIVSEVLEHIQDDDAAMREVSRVLKPGAHIAVTVPRWWPERICWAISREYRSTEGGHVRIYRQADLLARLDGAGFSPVASHHVHALHSPYWWLKCAFGVTNDRSLVPRLYHRFLVWDITVRPRATRVVERLLNPILGKSLVVYLVKQQVGVGLSDAA